MEANETSRLFNTKCVSTDLEFKLYDRIIVWHTDEIHKCPFNKLGSFEFQVYNDILVNSNEKLLLQIDKQVN